VEYKNKSDISNNRGNCNQFKIIQNIPEQHTGKLHQGTTEKSHIGHRTDARQIAQILHTEINGPTSYITEGTVVYNGRSYFRRLNTVRVT
jgi:hypothetical protein